MRVAKKSTLTVVPLQDDKTLQAMKELDDFIGTRSTRKKSATIPDAKFAVAMTEMNAMMRSGDWSKATPVHFVALYVERHLAVYGIECFEMTSKVRFFTMRLASMMLRDRFEEPGEMASYMKWVWDREKWRAENRPGAGSRIGWNLMFNGTLFTDYRYAQAKRRG